MANREELHALHEKIASQLEDTACRSEEVKQELWRVARELETGHATAKQLEQRVEQLESELVMLLQKNQQLTEADQILAGRGVERAE